MTMLLIDGNSLTYRAYFALPTDMATAGGQVTNAVYGFTSMLVNLLRDHAPDAIAVAFDRPEPTFRHEQEPSYKAQRDATPDLLVEQFGLVRQILAALQITVVETVGFEADDVLATLATRAKDAGEDVIVVTGDRDAYQLVEDPHIKVLYNKRGVSDYALYDEAGIEERTGVKAGAYVQYAALRGDPSDNLPGVPGVGEKTAARLVTKYGDLDGIFEHVDEQTPKLRQNLTDHEATARRNVDLMRLVRDVPLEVTRDELTWTGHVDADEVRRLFAFLEFRALQERLNEVIDEPVVAEDDKRAVLDATVDQPESPADAVAKLAAMRGARRADDAAPCAVAATWSPSGTLDGLAMVTNMAQHEVLWVDAAMLAHTDVQAALAEVFATIAIAAHNAKPVLRALYAMGRNDVTVGFDSQLAAYLLDPSEARYVPAELLDRYAQIRLAGAPDAGALGQLDFGNDAETAAQKTAREALAVANLVEPLLAALTAQGMAALLRDIEVPLVSVLARMERVGVGVDRAVLTELNVDLTRRCEELSTSIQDAAGHPFNVNSTKQLQTVLFDEIGLTPQKKTKTGYSTDAASLEKLRGEHVIIDDLLQYRELEKLRSTYGEGLLAEIADDGRIHATFNQTVARTGRLSSDAPNLHNIPVRTSEGRAFRKAFVPSEGCALLVADYNQVELRCIAHLSNDPGLIAAFTSGEDIHATVAAQVFNVPVDQVSSEQRAKAKMVSYGLAYGMEAYGLAQRLAISVSEASEILDAYFVSFPSVHAYMDQTVEEARKRGYTETLFGRRRPIPELSSPNARIRQAGERQAMNAGIQGLAADIFKIALVKLDAALQDGGYASALILQVHDEVVLDVPFDEKEAVASMTESVLTGAASLNVPLVVNLAFGATWADAKA